MSKKDLPDISTWVKLQEAVPKLTNEDMAKAVLDQEKEGPRRIQWLLRLHGKYAALRGERERRELMSLAGTQK